MHKKSRYLAREKAFVKFHARRLKEFPAIWEEFLPCVSCLLSQSVNRRVFEKLLAENFSATPAGSDVQTGIFADEENTIRYVSGFIPYKLLCKYKKENTSKAGEFVECLNHMAVEGPESNFYDYTRMWIKLVDRGGLYHVSDNCYLFFRALELKTRHLLPQHLQNPSKSKDLLIKELLDDEDIQFFWSMLSVDISDPDTAYELLQDVATLWITIRGFSLAGAWMEKYKEKKKSVKRTKALRKSQKIHSDSSEAFQQQDGQADTDEPSDHDELSDHDEPLP